MYPELFEIPFTNLTIKSYGLMMVIGFLTAVWLIRRLTRNITSDSALITNAALYSLMAGIAGARLFYVIHYFYKFKGNLLSVFAIWEGGLELLGGVVLALAVILFYLRRHKLPIRHYLDVLAIALMLALAFGRIGCFMNGCCFGKPTNLSWAVRFPYDSPPYRSQIYPDLSRNRTEPHLELPIEFFGYYNENGVWSTGLKPYESLSDEQKERVRNGPYRCLSIHPTQLYSSGIAAFWCFMFYLFWRRQQKSTSIDARRLLVKPGDTFGLMFIAYGITRFFMEFLRDDNPIEPNGITISQSISIAMVILGIVLILIFEKMRPYKAPSQVVA